jgi:hypothetical protein
VMKYSGTHPLNTGTLHSGASSENGTCVVYLDFSRAFDMVWHNGLLYKLRCIGMECALLNRFKSYMGDRKQRLVIKGQSSDCLLHILYEPKFLLIRKCDAGPRINAVGCYRDNRNTNIAVCRTS